MNGLSVLARALEILEPGGPNRHLAFARILAAIADIWPVPHGDTRVLYESLEMYAAAGDRWGQALTLEVLGFALRHSDPEEALRCAQQSLHLRRQLGDRWGIALAVALPVLLYLVFWMGQPTDVESITQVGSFPRAAVSQKQPTAAAYDSSVYDTIMESFDLQETDSEKPTPEKAAKRPDWVDAPQGKVGNAYQMVTSVGPYTTRLKCDRQLPGALRGLHASAKTPVGCDPRCSTPAVRSPG